MALRRAAQLLPSSLRALALPQQQRAYADLNLSDPAILKKFIGIEEALGGADPDPRGTFEGLLRELEAKLATLPEASDYRRATEATTQYRLKVLASNDSNAAVEEVLDAHVEELILETREELALVPLMDSESVGWQGWMMQLLLLASMLHDRAPVSAVSGGYPPPRNCCRCNRCGVLGA
jgi:NADH dehydrogenase (ubiquinone) 1 alpha subcomplex subunit 5